MDLLQLSGALELGLIYALVAIGVYITYRVMDFADLTVDGSFPLGAAVTASLLVKGVHPLLAILCASGAGALAGSATALLHIRGKIIPLLSGILVMLSLYSINLRIMSKPNIALLDELTLFSGGSILTILASLLLLVLVSLGLFFASEPGLAMRGAGANPRASAAQGISVSKMKWIALALSNAIVAFAGGLFAQSQGFADIAMGTGTVIVGLAAVIVGEALLRPQTVFGALLVCVVGAVVYRVVIVLALSIPDIGLKASDLNLVTAGLVITTLLVTQRRKGALL